MKHRFGCGPHRHFSPPDDSAGSLHRGRHHGPGRGRRHGGRLFDYGELRLLLLAIIADAPSHGYELIKTVEERFGGSYSPSPGVIYPTLAWLDDMGYAVIEHVEGGRKRYRITAEGGDFLKANRAVIDEIMARAGARGPGGREGVPAPVVRAMENLKLALRLRLRANLDEAAAETIAAALDLAATTVEKS